MRNISDASLAKLTQKTGTEPVVIVECFWNIGQAPAVYGDKRVEGVDPRILQIANLEDVVNAARSGTSQSVTMVMDDTDGHMKYVFDHVDLHKKRVAIYQWFTGLDLSEKFLLFAGEILSPVIWKEGDRTLSITVTSQFQDIEIGFSPEEGSFANLPQNLVGTVWPIVFGTVAKLPTIRVDDIPYGDRSGSDANSITTDGTGIRDPALEPSIKDNENQAGYAAILAQAMFIGYLEASFTARKHGELGDFDSIEKGNGRFSGLAKQYLQQGNQYLLQAQTVRRNNNSLTVVKDKQAEQEKSKIGVTNGSAFPQGKQMSINIGGAQHTGYFLGSEFIIQARIHPENEIYEGIVTPDPAQDDLSLPTFGRTTFFYADAGVPLMIGTAPTDIDPFNPATHVNEVRYIVASRIRVTVNALYAYRTLYDIKALYPIPSSYYEVHQLDFGSLPVTLVYFYQPLSSRLGLNGKNEGWEDEVFATVTSPIGPNTVDIIQWIIENYTSHGVDADSFNTVRGLVATYPSHFALTDRQQAISLVGQIARQARCMVWLKNNVYYIKYMPVKVPPVAEITEADIIEQTLEVSYTESEDVMTKVIASWRADYITKPYLVILRYNIRYYGMHERRDNYFIYNMQQLVEKSATFWLIREANTYKKVSLKVPIKHLKIETMDTVRLNFASKYVANGPVDCLVEGASVDTNDYTISLNLWVPIRAGEMFEYVYAYPGNLTIEYVYPTPDDISSGRAEDRGVTMPTGGGKVTKPFTGPPGNGGQLHVTHRPMNWGADPSYTPDLTPANSVAPIIQTRLDTNQVRPLGTKPPGTTKYKVDRAKVKKATLNQNVYPGAFPAKVVSGSGDTYTCKVYNRGVDKDPMVVSTVQQLQIDPSETIPPDTWCVVVSTVYVDNRNNVTEKWYMQVPVWL